MSEQGGTPPGRGWTEKLTDNKRRLSQALGRGVGSRLAVSGPRSSVCPATEGRTRAIGPCARPRRLSRQRARGRRRRRIDSVGHAIAVRVRHLVDIPTFRRGGAVKSAARGGSRVQEFREPRCIRWEGPLGRSRDRRGGRRDERRRERPYWGKWALRVSRDIPSRVTAQWDRGLRRTRQRLETKGAATLAERAST